MSTFLSATIGEPNPRARSCYGLEEAGCRALEAAAAVTGHPARPTHRRDIPGTRGLAGLVLHEASAGHYSWSDVAWAVYGRRKSSTAITAAARWRGTVQAGRAGDRYREKQEAHNG